MLSAKKTNDITASIRKSISSTSKEMIFSFCSTLARNTESSSKAPSTSGTGIYVNKALWDGSICHIRLRDLGLFSLKKRKIREDMVSEGREGRGKQGPMARKQQAQIQTRDISSGHKKILFSL